MSLFGSMFVAVSGLGAQSQAMSAVSNNISNVNTTGYKKIEISFGSIVTAEGGTGKYTPGSVQSVKTLTASQQGAIQQTSSSTDVSIIGNGMFVVQRSPQVSSLEEKLYTRAGSFQEDAQGFLRNKTGYYLMGWPLDSDGNLPAAQADPGSLMPVDVAFLGGLTKATTKGNIAFNLEASQAAATYPIPETQAPHFSRGLIVYDSLGQRQDMEFQFTKHVSPTASARSSVVGIGMKIDDNLNSIADINVGEEIVISVGGDVDTYTITAGSTVQDLIDFVNNSPTLRSVALAVLNAEGQVEINAIPLGTTVSVTDGAISSGSGAATVLGFASTPPPAAPTIFPGGAAQMKDLPNPNGWWQLDIVNSKTGATISSGSINFMNNGKVNANPDIGGDVKISVADIEWGNGSSRQDINISIDSLSQFAGAYNVVFAEQDGAELGLRTGIEIDSSGIVSARFSNGQRTNLYKIPLATFTNYNGLAEVSGNVYVAAREAGSFNLRESGTGGAGLINGASLEGSNVDLAEEFAKMITIQRSYAANSKVLTTADQMTEDLLRV